MHLTLVLPRLERALLHQFGDHCCHTLPVRSLLGIPPDAHPR